MKENITAAVLGNCQALGRWLSENGVDTTTWNSADAKGIHALWHELERGETTLSAGPIRRNVRVVALLIKRGDDILFEVAQKMRDGRVRRRSLPPSEKLVVGEDPFKGARRCLREELNVDPAGVLVSYAGKEERERDSPSYPGIRSVYEVHYVTLALPQLPDHDFTIPNRGDADEIVTHTWGWRPHGGQYPL